MGKTRTKQTIAADEGIDSRLLKALGHPLRQRILRVLNDRVASPVELSRELDEALGNVSYHVRTLEDLGAVELVRTEPVRGALEHFYRATTRVELNDAHWAKLPVSVRRKLFDQTQQLIWEHVVAAAAETGFDDPQAHVSWTPLDLDEEGYQEVVEVLAETLEQVLAAQARSSGRLTELGDEGRARARRTEVVLLHFDRAAAQADPDRKP